jgi:hypothetical protein
MLNAGQFRELIVQSTLRDLNKVSKDAEELIMFTCAAESNGGTYIKEVNGPALGIFQMEPMTYNDIWDNYIKHKASLSLLLVSNFDVTFMPSEERMIYDLRFATAMARIHYLRVKEPLPNANNVDAMWEYYKLHYNTLAGKAQKDHTINAYHEFIKK